MDLILSSVAFWRWIAEVLIVFFLIGGIVGLAVGVGLILNSECTLRFLATLNRWVSLRSATKPLEIPRDTTRAVQKHRRWLAVIFIAGGAFATFVLATKFDPNAARNLLNLQSVHPLIALSLIDFGRWILIVGNLAAVAVGVLLAFFPATLAAIETGGSNWFSERRQFKDANTPLLSLDNWVAAYPRRAGVIITVGALLMLGTFAITLFGGR